MSEEHKHDWMTKYSSRMGVDGVEWFCRGCKENLSWPEVWRRVNTIEEMEQAVRELVAHIKWSEGENAFDHTGEIISDETKQLLKELN